MVSACRNSYAPATGQVYDVPMQRRSAYVFVIALAGCGSVSAAGADAAPEADAAGPEWTVEATDPDPLGSWFHAVGVGTVIYYSRDEQELTRFFRHYDTPSKQV